MSLVQPFRDYIEGLVHPSVRHDELAARRHHAFIAARLVMSLTAIAAFPVYLALRGTPGVLEVAVFAWLVLPMLAAYFLSRTGLFDVAHVLSSFSLTGMVFSVACATGGIASFAAVWLLAIPLEAALSASRRIVAIASAFAVTAALALLALGEFKLLPDPVMAQGALLSSLGIVSGILYASGTAFGAESIARAGFSLLGAEEERYRLLARNMTDVITRHGRNGTVQFVSPAAESLFGARISDLLGHGLFDRVHVADRPAYLSALADASMQKEPQSIAFRVRRPSGAKNQTAEFIWVEMSCRPLDGNASDASAWREVVAVMRDISDRKNQEDALHAVRAESDRANAAKTRFLATMSHELRTPLNAIIGFSEMLVNKDIKIDVPRQQEYAQLINDSGQHLLSVVNGILDMSKIETGDFAITPEPFAPMAVIEHCCDILRLKARDAKIVLSIKPSLRLPDITADKRAFRQIMLNLLSNAIKFSNPGGAIVVDAGVTGSRLTVTVEDRGIGISPADLACIGDPFFQASSAYDRRHDGTGLGLSIVKGLVDLHGGEFKVVSALGKGTTISISLPLDCDVKAQPIDPAPRSATVSVLQRPQDMTQDMTVRKSA